MRAVDVVVESVASEVEVAEFETRETATAET